MKKLLISLILLVSVTAVQAADWNVKPKLYVRGGFTQSLDLTAKGTEISGFDKRFFNHGSWGEESNAFIGNLTEVDMIANYKDLATVVYGVNFDHTTRFENQDGGSKTFKERQAYIEMHKILGEHGTIWFGRRPYRGFGDYLTGSFPLDERNMFGGGIKLKAGPGQYEFAYGTNDKDMNTNDDSSTKLDEDFVTTNMFLNKYILPITDGNITANIEIHQNNSKSDKYKSYGYQAGAQYARWNMKLLNASWYNIFVLNYSNGHLGDVEAGLMQSLFDSVNKNERASKVLVKIGGDLKSDKWSAFYTARYQLHMGNLEGVKDQNWQFVDLHARPMYALTSNVGLGVDYIQRIVIKDTDASGKEWSNKQNMWRAGLMLNYHLNAGGKNLFENSEVSLIAGRVHQQKETKFFQGREAKKDANFIRFKYTMEI